MIDLLSKLPELAKPAFFSLLLLAAGGAFAGEQAPAGMVRVSSGIYRPLFQGTNSPQRVKAFLMDVCPVTNGEFLEFVRTHPQWRRSQVKRLFADENYLKDWSDDLDLGQARSNAPVTSISWFAAKAYASAKGRRLPTVAEWEYAAAASPTRRDGENDSDFTKEILLWYSTPATTTLPPVQQKQANLFGIHDLHGLVWEWTADFNSALVTGDARANSGRGGERFCGAGAQGANDNADFPAFLRYGFRSSLQASYCIHNLGFRCAKDI